MPQPGYGHLLYAVTMLVRQARLSLLDIAQRAEKNIDLGTNETLVLDALETFAARFEAAREEIGAAHGREWENDLLDLIAKTLRIKRARIVEWSKVLKTATKDCCSDHGLPPGQGGHGSVEGQESTTEARNDTPELSFEQLDRSLLDDIYQESWLWGSDPLGMFCTDQGNFLEEAVGTGITSLPNTGFENQ